jgi:hypothetical protein
MCCNGVLFFSVVLQQGDSARALRASGLKIKRKAGQEFFHQPCSAHRGCRCAIYAERPSRCRLFNCRQLVRLATGETTEAAAFEKIEETHRLTARVEELIRRAGDSNPNRSLSHRCANALTTTEWGPEHDALQAAMHELEALLAMEFRVE